MADEMTDAPRAQARELDIDAIRAWWAQGTVAQCENEIHAELVPQLLDRFAALRDEHARLKEALGRYAQHRFGCPAFPTARVVPDGWVGDDLDGHMTYRHEPIPPGECTCGFSAALTESQ